jgi:hypothetical protein
MKKRFEWPWQQVIFFVLVAFAIISLALVMKSMNDRMSSFENKLDEVRALALMPE